MIPQTPDIMPSPLCYEGDTRNILEDTPLGTNQLSYKLGFPPITSVSIKAGGIAPSRVDMNAALKLLSIHTYFVQSGNKYKYSNLLDYEIGSTVLGSDNALYYCIQANGATSPNTVQDPTASSGYWNLLITEDGKFNAENLSVKLGAFALLNSIDLSDSKITGLLPVSKLNLPVGFIYIQFRGQSTPDALFGTSGKWQDISSEYAGEFFRAVGGNSGNFGVTQAEGLPNITGGVASGTGIYQNALSSFQISNEVQFNVSQQQGTAKSNLGFDASISNSIYGASTHVTPYNSAIRIWKKIS